MSKKRKQDKSPSSSPNYSSFNESNSNKVTKNVMKEIVNKVVGQSILENRAKKNVPKIKSLKQQGKTVIARNRKRPFNFGRDSLGQRLGVWLPPGTAPFYGGGKSLGIPPNNFDPDGMVLFDHRTFNSRDPGLDPQARRLHLNGGDFLQHHMNQIQNQSAGQFYRVFGYNSRPYPQPITRIYNTGEKHSLRNFGNFRNLQPTNINTTPVNAVFDGIILMPTYNHYHRSPDNIRKELLSSGYRGSLRRWVSGLATVFIPDKSLDNYLKKFNNKKNVP